MRYCFGKGYFKNIEDGIEREWVLGNGLGGYASSTIIGANGRSHHNYLNVSFNEPIDRYSLFSKTNEILEIGQEEVDCSSQMHINFNKDGQNYLSRFILDESVPTYEYSIKDVTFRKTISMEYGKNTVVVCYEIKNGINDLKFRVVPLFTFKKLGETLERGDLNFNVHIDSENNILKLNHIKNKNVDINFFSSEGEFYDRRNIKTSLATPNYLVEENVFYKIDNRNGFLGLDNFATPYELILNLKPFQERRFYIKCSIDSIDEKDGFEIVEEYKNRMIQISKNINIDNEYVKLLAQSADHFIVKRKSTNLKTILAGYPWFTDWGRDTMISIQGLTLCTRRFEDARQILESFAFYEKDGLIPNVFPDSELNEAIYNTVDASLWYFHSVDKYLNYTNDYEFIKSKIYPVLKNIIKAYKEGTRFSIKMNEDGLISAGSDFDQVTWMDVRVGDLVITPRHGKPVEINALWYNALKVMEKLSKRFNDDFLEYKKLSEIVKKSFNEKFWSEKHQCLKDVVDDDDFSVRPNQIYAVYLPYTMLSDYRSKKIVEKIHSELYTIYGIRSLSPVDPRFKGEYIGKLFDRDCAYHMGTSWTFLMGGFLTSYCKVNNYSEQSITEVKHMCETLLDTLSDGCINGIAEIFDGNIPCISRGCSTQAWSVGEILRVYVEDILNKGKVSSNE